MTYFSSEQDIIEMVTISIGSTSSEGHLDVN